MASSPDRLKLIFPPEIWKEVFTYATRIPGKDEFGLAESSCYPMRCDNSDTSVVMDEEDLGRVIQMRLDIIRVCKAWYFIGLEGLWSHLRLSCDKWAASPLRVYYSLIRKPKLASFAQRLTIKTRPSLDPPPSLNFITKKLVPLLTSLKIISCPLICGIDEYPLPAEITFLEQAARVYLNIAAVVAPTVNSWSNTRALTANFGIKLVYAFDRHELSFPQLVYLHVNAEVEDTVQYIVDKWKLPKLQMLSIRGVNTTLWRDLLAKYPQLHKLEMTDIDLDHPIGPLVFPSLTSLYVSTHMDVCSGINASKLERFGIFDIVTRSAWAATRLARRAVNSFPVLKQLCLSVHLSDQSQESIVTFLEKELDPFCKGGIGLEIDTYV